MNPIRLHRRLALLGAVFAIAAGRAAAEPITDDEMMVVKPEGMNDRAQPLAKLPWCEPTYQGDSWQTGRLRRAVGSTQAFQLWAEAAEHFCEHAEDPTWRKQATYLVQAWMNARNKSQPDAEKEIRDAILKLRAERANEGREPTDEERFAFAAQQLTPIQPENGADAARIGDKPAWCDRAQIEDKWTTSRISGSVKERYGIDGLIGAALHICQRPSDPTWKTEAGYILQQWMNFTHLPQSEAEATLRARIQTQKFAADKESLCKALEEPPEASGEVKTFARAQLRFFGCGRGVAPLWQDRDSTDDDVGFYLDVADRPENELLRLYWLFNITPRPWGEHELPSRDPMYNRSLLYYAVAQRDYARVGGAPLAKVLAEAPYNDYARTIASESVGVLVAQRQAYEQAVDKLAKGDEDYTNILRTAPAKAFSRWETAEKEWKAEIERSNAFERKLSGPSRKALKGCAAELHKDAQKLVRSFKADSYRGLADKVASDPIAVLLLSRLAVCDAIDQVWGGSGALRDLINQGRTLRGPRSLAYYAIVDAIAEAQKDRPKLLVQVANFWYRGPSLFKLYEDVAWTGAARAEPDKSACKGVVSQVSKVPGGVQVTFKTQKLVFPEYQCSDDTRHPLRVTSDGRIEYYRNCRATGKMESQDNTPRPIVIASELDAGVKPGAYVACEELSQTAKNGSSYGVIVYTKKSSSEKRLQTFFGFAL